MNQKELHVVKLISCLIEHKQLRMKGREETEPSFYKIYHMDKGNAPFDERTLRRYLDELCEKEIFQKKDDEYYIIHPNYISEDLSNVSPKWKKFMDTILASGETDIYVMLRKLFDDKKDVFMDDIKLKRYSDSVKEPIYSLRSNKDVIRHINEAMDKGCRIRVEYKGKEYTILPLCYVMSRDGMRTYLYYERKGRLNTPMILQDVNFLGEERNARDVDRQSYMEQVKGVWDVEVGKGVEVKILVRRNLKTDEDYRYVIDVLKNYFGDPISERDDYFIFSGQVLGIDDFKGWLRKYIDICIVQEPVSLKDELIGSLKNKIERYEVDDSEKEIDRK